MVKDLAPIQCIQYCTVDKYINGSCLWHAVFFSTFRSPTALKYRLKRRVVAKPVEPAQPKLVGLAVVGGEAVGVGLVGAAVLGGAGPNDTCCVLLLSVYIFVHT